MPNNFCLLPDGALVIRCDDFNDSICRGYSDSVATSRQEAKSRINELFERFFPGANVDVLDLRTSTSSDLPLLFSGPIGRAVNACLGTEHKRILLTVSSVHAETLAEALEFIARTRDKTLAIASFSQNDDIDFVLGLAFGALCSNSKAGVYLFHAPTSVSNQEEEEDVKGENSICVTLAQPNNKDSFDKMGLKDELRHGIYNYGFEKPSVFQQRVIPACLEKRDVIAMQSSYFKCDSYTDATAAFAIAILQQLDPELEEVQALVLTYLSELAQQIQRVFLLLGEFMKIRCQVCSSVTTVIKASQVVVGTPDKAYYFLCRGALSPIHIKLFVLDMTDESLLQVFRDQIYSIFTFLPQSVQCIFSSGTMAPEVVDITKKFMTNPIEILVKNDEKSPLEIRQFYIQCEKEEWKFDTLVDLYETVSIAQTIIFCNSNRKVEWLVSKMREKEFTVSYVHGEMDEKERNAVMREFRSLSTRILITTDFARFVNIQQLGLVINYDLPIQQERYIQRFEEIAGSGRFGKKAGVAISFLNKDDEQVLKDLERYYDTKIEALPQNIMKFIN